MSLLDSFRPRWKHNDPEVRAEAVRELDDPASLLEVARGDSESAIRRLAIKKIDDPAALAELGATDADPGVREIALGRARDLLLAAATGKDGAAATVALAALDSEWDLAEVAKRGALTELREAALARIRDLKVLADVARRAEEAAIRSSALARVTDPALLIEVALHDSDKEVSELVVARIGDRAALEEIEKRGKSKRARALASLKLSQMRATDAPSESAQAEIPPEKIREARLAQVCRRAEAAESEDELAAAQAAWADLVPGEPDGEYLARFQQAVEAFREGVASRARAEAERAEADRAREQAARDEAQKALAASEGDATTRAELEARHKEQEEKRAASQVQARKRFEETILNLEGLVETGNLKAAERAVKRADEFLDKATEVAAEERPALVEKLRAVRDRIKVRALELREAEEWKRWANVPRLEELCAKVEALVEATDLKQAAHDLRSAQAEWKTLPAPRDKSEPLWHRFKAASDQVYTKCKAHFHELDEQRSANLKQKEALCEKVEALQDSTEWNQTAEAIKKLQEEWKTTGPVPREIAEDIWKRFRGACDKFFDRRKEQFGKQDAARDANLKKLHELVEKAEALQDSNSWISTAEAIKKLQLEWKATGPAPHKAGESAWNRFRAACDQFFERRKAEFGKMDSERSENLKRKEDIIARLESVVAAATLPSGLERIDHWMGEWKAVGPAPREQADAVWERFRTACDRLRERTRSSEGPREPRREGRGRGRGPGAPAGAPAAPVPGAPPRYTPRGAGPGGRDRDRDRGPGRERGGRGERGDRGDRGDRSPMVLSSSGPQFANKLPLQAIAARLKKAVPAEPAPAESATTTASEPTELAPAQHLLAGAPAQGALPAAPSPALLPAEATSGPDVDTAAAEPGTARAGGDGAPDPAAGEEPPVTH